MADVEQRAEAEAAHKGLSGGAAKAYVGGVFNRIRQAHSRGTQPGKGARHLQRRARVEARQEAKNRIARHEQLGALEKLRLRMRTRQEEPRKPAQTSAPSEKRGHADGSGIPQLQPGYQPSARELRGNVSLVHGPEEAQGTIKPLQPAPTPAQPAALEKQRLRSRTHREEPRKVGEAKPIPGQLPVAFAGLKPVGGYSANFDLGKRDPYELRKVFGREQLPRALDEYSAESLDEMARTVEDRTGKRYTGGKSKAKLKAWIMANMDAQPAPTPPQPAATKAAKPKRERVQQPPRLPKPLVPIKEMPIGFQLDATRKLDPYFIREYFGDAQLPRALDMQTYKNLREAVEVVEEKTGKKYSGPRTLTAMRKWILANM